MLAVALLLVVCVSVDGLHHFERFNQRSSRYHSRPYHYGQHGYSSHYSYFAPSRFNNWCRPCNCKKAQWTDWGQWSSCDLQDCNSEDQTRSRTCFPTGISEDCVGEASETRVCDKPMCSAQWTGWGQWSSCDLQDCDCEDQTRSRTCFSTGISEDCVGEVSETRVCDKPMCADEWTQWSPWTICLPLPCRKRSRNCCPSGNSDNCPDI